VKQSRNPYDPPEADVGAGELRLAPRPRPPAAVIVALVLLAIDLILGGIRLVAMLAWVNDGMIRGLDWLIELLALAFFAGVCIMVALGHNWARWLLLAVTMYFIFLAARRLWPLLDRLTIEGVRFAQFWLPMFLTSLPALLKSLSCILLFWPGRRWFASREPAG
jgi:hypothetical protein